eukprot:CAMPEP_0172935138 /NCGR_PEP_ID=MMETSP1075-20121228/221365_1 /TAXON_ID=2916 /ORGANISM="Ceratium fusus, Strain PA161109" /LENGTH=217 /DNA_ID=CAMNT_0013796497 /DNA_START=122 /DNA_END=774 /DNA_ORIENTATION=+
MTTSIAAFVGFQALINPQLTACKEEQTTLPHNAVALPPPSCGCGHGHDPGSHHGHGVHEVATCVTAAAAVTVTGVITFASASASASSAAASASFKYHYIFCVGLPFAVVSASASASSAAASASFKYHYIFCVGLPFAVVEAFLVLNTIPFLKSLIATLTQRIPVNKDIVPAIIGFDEAKAPIVSPAKSGAGLYFGHGGSGKIGAEYLWTKAKSASAK